MVPVNFHQLRQDLRQVLLATADQMAIEWDPFLVAWLCYALSTDGIQNNQPLQNLLDRMRRWLQEEAWSYDRNLGPVGFSLWLLQKAGDALEPESVSKFVQKLATMNADQKLSLLRDAEQVFLMALGVAAIGDNAAKGHLASISKEQMRLGPFRRRILYAAALRELNDASPISKVDLADELADEGDIIALVWWSERYRNDRYQAWERFSSIADCITLNPENTSEAQRILSMPEMAMLYQAASEEAKHPEPALLFDFFPFCGRLREIAREHFMNEKYVAAVFEATKALNEMIQKVSGVTDKNEAELVQATMKQIGKPSDLKIRFNDFLHEDSGKNEQAGLAMIYEGVFKAFRNPKGHKPQDHPLVELDAYEALHQLIVINYLMLRIEKATTEKKHAYGK
jgi:uncharacterized protein (TIGR02391 family)